jgi:hypothetical protein
MSFAWSTISRASLPKPEASKPVGRLFLSHPSGYHEARHFSGMAPRSRIEREEHGKSAALCAFP